MKIHLFRHAQSEANVNNKILLNNTDPSIKLTTIGLEQAKESSMYLANILNNNNNNIKVWNSPFARTRKTKDIFLETINNKVTFEQEESIYVAERNFGLVDSTHEYDKKYLDELSYYKQHVNHNTQFFCKPPLGESPFELCQRVDFFLKNYIEKSNCETHVVFTHLATIKAFRMMLLSLKYEEFDSYRAKNASILSIDLVTKEISNYNPTTQTM